VVEAITPKTRLIFIANPNNPTGTLIPQDKIDSFMTQVPPHVVVVFDEAYYEFLEQPVDTFGYIRQQRNVVVLRTFSKIHGLAGLRVGYGIAHPDLIAVQQKAREPFNVNSIAQVGALAALQDIEHEQRTRQVVDQGRIWMEQQLNSLGVPFVPGSANFVMVNVGDGQAVFHEMLKRKVIVRPLRGYGLAEWLRITIGTPEQNRRAIDALREAIAPTHT
jgi:histidinol-phosphate aminotransferase